jgi:hypothetical protein
LASIALQAGEQRKTTVQKMLHVRADSRTPVRPLGFPASPVDIEKTGAPEWQKIRRVDATPGMPVKASFSPSFKT